MNRKSILIAVVVFAAIVLFSILLPSHKKPVSSPTASTQHASVLLKDPIYKYTPHSTNDYYLQAVLNNNSITLEVKLLLTNNTMDSTSITNIKQNVISYIKSVGLDPSKYTINYSY